MYITEQELKFHLREQTATLRELAGDLGGDIRFLHQEIHELREHVSMLQQELMSLRNRQNEP